MLEREISASSVKSTIETKEGTLYVSKPFLSSGSKKLRALIAFTPRTSHFDTKNAQSGVNEFRVNAFPIRATLLLIVRFAGLLFSFLDFFIPPHGPILRPFL